MTKFGYEVHNYIPCNCVMNQQWIFKFDNSYGASIIKGPYSYGGPEGKYELAVIRWYGAVWDLCYDTDITDDVLGHLSEDEVNKVLKEIEAL